MKNAHLRVFRGDNRQGSYKEYEIPLQEGMVVLDAIHHIQAREDNNLAVRWNCKAGKCGSCSAEINGKPKLLCMTRMDTFKEGEPITVAPMKAFPVIKDLVCDVSWNYEINKKIPPFKPGPKEKDGTYRMQQRDIDRCQEFRKCIECFLCQDVCHVIRNHKKEEFAGPRFMVRLASLEMHPLDTADRIPLVKEEFGVGLCNITKCCTEVCPENITITDNAIIPLKERVVTRYYDPVARLLRKLFPTLFGFWILSFVFAAQALPPPMSESDLRSQADYILKGKITGVECRLKMQKKFCGMQYFYKAFLETEKVLKKPSAAADLKKAEIYFSQTKYNRGCTGDQDYFPLPGEVGTYYLRQGSDGDEKGIKTVLSIINWNGAEIEKTGDSEKIPNCTSPKK